MTETLVFDAIAFFLTISVFLYLVGDNFLFRASIYVFVGVSAGYVAALVWNQVLTPQLIEPILFGSADVKIYVALFLVILLLMKAFPPLSKLGTPPLALMVGVGAAIAIAGAVTGTLFPQILAAINIFDLEAVKAHEISHLRQVSKGIVMMLGTVSTLIYFQFSAKKCDDGKYRRNPVTKALAFIGKIFIAITLGAIFAGVLSAALTALIERLDFLISFIFSFFS